MALLIESVVLLPIDLKLRHIDLKKVQQTSEPCLALFRSTQLFNRAFAKSSFSILKTECQSLLDAFLHKEAHDTHRTCLALLESDVEFVRR
jgi:hypothetical protein